MTTDFITSDERTGRIDHRKWVTGFIVTSVSVSLLLLIVSIGLLIVSRGDF